MLYSPNAISRSALLGAAALLLLSAMPDIARARLLENLYRVEIPVPDQSQSVRNAVFDKGLEQVLIRMSGKRDVMTLLQPGSAAAYVQTYTYLEEDVPPAVSAADEGSAATAARTPGYILQVEYNSARILTLLRSQQQPVWGSRRDDAVIWLAVRDGVNRYVLADGDASLLKAAAQDASKRRGLPLVWPLYDLDDQQRMQFADIWAAFEQPLKQASQRYGSGPVLVGRVSWDGDRWTGEWSVFVEGERRNWSLGSADYSALVNEAIDRAADAVAAHHAVLESPDDAGMVMVDILQLNKLGDFRKVQAYLAGLATVKRINVDRIDDEQVRFRIDLRGDTDDFMRSVSRDRMLRPVAGELQTTLLEGDKTLLQFIYQN